VYPYLRLIVCYIAIDLLQRSRRCFVPRGKLEQMTVRALLVGITIGELGHKQRAGLRDSLPTYQLRGMTLFTSRNHRDFVVGVLGSACGRFGGSPHVDMR
jgi:hypothetical protein